MADEAQGDGAAVARLAHRMNNAMAYVLTNLNLLAEELEDGRTDRDRRLVQLVTESTAGVDRIGDLIRELKMLAWSEAEPGKDEGSDDTWDEDRHPRRILVVDDEPYILASIRRALRHYDVEVAEGGQRAIDLLGATSGYDLVLCDLVMGEVTGMDVHKWIRDHRPGLHDRIVFMTAGAFTGEVREFLATVDNPVLHKPFDTKTLRWVIAQSLRRASQQATHP